MRISSGVATAALWVLVVASSFVSVPAALHSDTVTKDLASSTAVALQRRAFEGLNIKDPDLVKSNYYDELSHPAYGLFIWTNLARLTRINLRNGADHMPLPGLNETVSESGGTEENPNTITLVWDNKAMLMYFIPLLVFLASLALTCLTTCCTGCCICCCRQRRLGRRQKDPFTTRQKLFAAVGLAFVTIASFAATAGGISGSDFFGKSVTILTNSADKTFLDAGFMTKALNDQVDKTFNFIVTSIEGIADSATTLIDSQATAGASTNIKSMGTSCTAIETQLGELKTMAATIRAKKTGLSTDSTGLVAKLQAEIAATNSILSGLQTNAPVDTDTNTAFYRWAPTAAVNPETTDLETPRKAVRDSLNLQSIVNAAAGQVPSLAGVAQSATDAAANLTSEIQGLTTNPVQAIKAEFRSSIASVQTSITDVFGDVSVKIETYHADSKEYTQHGENYQLYRAIGFAVIFGIPALVLFAVLGGVGFHKPKLVKCCLCASIPYALLALLLAVLLLLLSVSFGEVCTITFDRSSDASQPSPMATLLNGISTDAGDYYNKVFKAREQCLLGNSVMDAVSFFYDTSEFDLSSDAQAEISKLDLTGIANSLTAEELVGTDPSVSAKTPTDDLHTAISGYSHSDTDGLKTALTTVNGYISTTIDLLQGRNPPVETGTSYNAIQLADIDISPGASSAEQAWAIVNMQRRITELRGRLIALQQAGGMHKVAIDSVSSILPELNAMVANAASIKTSVTSIRDDYAATKSFFLSAQQNVSDGIPDMQERMMVAVSDAQDMILSKNPVKCQEIARDTVDIEMGLCDGLLTSFDSFWFSFFILGTVGGMSIPVFIAAANVLADKDASRPKGSGASKKKKDGKAFDTGKPKEKGKGKGKDDVESGQIKWSAPKAEPAAGDHFQVSKTAALSPSEAEIPSPDSGRMPDSGRIYPDPHSNNLPPNYAEKQHLLPHPVGGSPRTSPRGSQRAVHPTAQPYGGGSPAQNRMSAQQPYPPVSPVDDIQEMRPSWLGGPPADVSGGGGGGHGVDTSYSPRSRHPHQPISPAGSYHDGPPARDSVPHSRRMSGAQHPEYEHVVSEFSKRVSHMPPPQNYAEDDGYSAGHHTAPQPYYGQQQPSYTEYSDPQYHGQQSHYDNNDHGRYQ
ncbi:hypothetical protein DFJ77DRAFT_466903 [Powellomyces hirtus]|nr:hypothetical protein DFJ77DRAFT_466903 [Powellomyces hirtus]